jgi:hypothetical protein
MMSYRKPIDYSLGDSLDEMLKRKTNFSKMMRHNDSAAEPVILSPNRSSQSGSSLILSHNEDKYVVPEYSMRKIQREVNAPFLLPQMDQYPDSITASWNMSNTLRNPIGKIISDDVLGKDLVMHSRHDESSKRREYKSSRCSPERSHRNLSYSATSTYGLFELLPEDFSLLTSDVEASLVVTSSLQDGQYDRFMTTGAWDQNHFSSKADVKKEAPGKRHLIDYDRLGSSPTELYTYISSSSSSTDLNGLKSLNSITPNQFSFLGQTSSRKPPKPPRIKMGKNLLSSSVAVDALKESEAMKRTNQILNSLIDSDSNKMCIETPAKSTSFNDDDITELSDLRFTYSPTSSASCLTPNNLKQRFLDFPSNDKHVQGNEELVTLYYDDKSTKEINPSFLETQLNPKDHEIDSDSFNSSLVVVVDDNRLLNDSISIGGVGHDNTRQTTNFKVGEVYQDESFKAAGPILKNHELDQVSFPSSLSSTTSMRYYESISSISPHKIGHDTIKNEKDSFSSIISSEKKRNIELDDDQSDIRRKLSSCSNTKEDVDKHENVFIGLCNDIAFLMTHGIHENEQIAYDEKSILDSSTYSETFYQENKDAKTNFHFCLQCGIDDIGENLDELNENISYDNTISSHEAFKVIHVVSGDQQRASKEIEIESFSEKNVFEPTIANTLLDNEVCDELNNFNIEIHLPGKVVDMNELESVLIEFEPCNGSEVHSTFKQSHFGGKKSKLRVINESDESKALPRMDIHVVEKQDVFFDDNFHPPTSSSNRAHLVADLLHGDNIQDEVSMCTEVQRTNGEDKILPDLIDASLTHPKRLENEDDFTRVRYSRWHYGENERFHNHEETLFRQSKNTIQMLKRLERRDSGSYENQKEPYLPDSNASAVLFEKKTFDLDETEIILALQGINKRVNSAMPHCLVPMGAFSDYARTFRPNYLESRLPDIDGYFDTIDVSLKVYEQGLKDKFFSEMENRIADVYIQPIFDLGESSNHHIDLPVDELPQVNIRYCPSKIMKELRIFNQILQDTLHLNATDCTEFDAQRADIEKNPNVFRNTFPFHGYCNNTEDNYTNSFDPECCVSINLSDLKNEMEDTYLDLQNILDIPIEEDPIWKEIPVPKLEVLGNHSPKDSTEVSFEISSTEPTGLNDTNIVTPCKECQSVTESREIRTDNLNLYLSELEIALLSNISEVDKKQHFFFRKDEWHHAKRIISAALESAEAVTRAKCTALMSWMEQKGKKKNASIQSGNLLASKEMIVQINSCTYKDLLQDDDTISNESESIDLITLSSSSSSIE